MEDRRLLVLYGSQTGTAQEVAEQIGRQGKRRYFKCAVMAMDDYRVHDLIREKLIVFVCATTGQGDVPDNMTQFWRFLLRKHLPRNSLSAVNFALVGLGDSSYVKFNFVAKKLFKRLCQLGANPIMQNPALADDQHDLGIDAVVLTFVDELWNEVLKFCPLPPGKEVISDSILGESKFSIHEISENNGYAEENGEKRNKAGEQPSSDFPFLARIKSNVRITEEDHFQDVRLIKLDITNSGISYVPGDVMAVQPSNSPDNVKQFFEITELNPNLRIIATTSDENVTVPTFLRQPITLQECVTKFWDIQSVPKKFFFELLSHFADNELEKERLLEFCSAEGQQDRYDYCNRPKRNIIEALRDFPIATSNVPLKYYFDLIPQIKPRSFSIASSLAANPGEAHLLVAVVEFKTVLKKPRRGLCSTYLSKLNPGDAVPVWAKKGTLSLPQNSTTPVIMVGPGTGVAPFRSLIQEKSTARHGGSSSSCVLFFGCRNKNKDFYFATEWQRVVDDGSLLLFTAFSRDQDRKIYVQDKMREQSTLLWKLLDQDEAWFMLAGNSKQMPTDVIEALKHVIIREGNLSENEADEYLKTLERKKRLQTETWS